MVWLTSHGESARAVRYDTTFSYSSASVLDGKE